MKFLLYSVLIIKLCILNASDEETESDKKPLVQGAIYYEDDIVQPKYQPPPPPLHIRSRKSINYSNLELSDEILINFSQGIRRGEYPHLIHLNLANARGITFNGLEFLVEALEASAEYLNLESLNLSGLHIDEILAQKIRQAALAGALRNLHTLILVNTQFEARSLLTIFHQTDIRNIQKLNLSQNPKLGNYFHYLSKMHASNRCFDRLVTLHVADCGITDEDIVQFFAPPDITFPLLQNLSLSGNRIQSGLLFEALNVQIFPQLQRLAISNTHMKDSDMHVLAHIAEDPTRNQWLVNMQYFNFSHNDDLTDEAWKALNRTLWERSNAIRPHHTKQGFIRFETIIAWYFTNGSLVHSMSERVQNLQWWLNNFDHYPNSE